MSKELLSGDKVGELTEPRRVRARSRRDALRPPNTAKPRRARRKLPTVARPHWLQVTKDLAVVLIFAVAAVIFGIGAIASSDPWPFLWSVLTATAGGLYALHNHVRSLNKEGASTEPR